ncbi:hypothetical protein Cgig2_018243 [Carnegiea gigantea]|uniref:DUF7792 domain-containing protein n=1 Tax=Carnegiea gigantea TaxID=171969 RepID=A0A9Q1KXP6_9CARY|nr:hypothetical protein Cgig2_018243 [Carnegiea gigantea]
MSPAAAPLPEEMRIQEELSYPILLSERIRKAVDDAVFFKVDCSDIGKQVDHLSTMLRSAVRLSSSAAVQLYDRPIRRVSNDVSRNLYRALSLIRRCRRRSFLCRVVRMVSTAEFRKVLSLLEASIGDMQWLLSILDCTGGGGSGTGISLSLPPITSNDPILAWVWSFIATVQMASQISDRIEAANELTSLAEDNDRNKKIIVEEGGVPPLLKLLKETSSSDAQIAAANALCSIANHHERVLSDSPMRVQIRVSNLVATMVEHDSFAKEEFARENVIRPLVSLLSFETFEGELDPKRFSFHSIVQINEERENKERNSKPQLLPSLSLYSSDGVSSRGGQNRKERENESPEVKRELKISCSRALLMLAKDSLSNSRSISETKGLLCLAKLIEKETGELQRNCLMAVMEITLAAELNADLRRSAFKTNSTAARAVVEQLLNVINETDDLSLQIPAVKSLGALSRTFPARETRVIGPLVAQLSNNDIDVATEAAIALAKFAYPENFLCQEHSKAIIEFDGVLPLMRLAQANERAQAHGLILLCYLAINASNHQALERAKVLTALEAAERIVSPQQVHLRDLINKAICHLHLYRGHIHPHRQPSLRK